MASYMGRVRTLPYEGEVHVAWNGEICTGYLVSHEGILSH